MEQGPEPGHQRLPCPYHPEALRQLHELLLDWGYDPELYGDFEQTGIVVHSGAGDFCGRVTIHHKPNNPAWQVVAIHRSWALTFHTEITRVRELRCVLELALRTDVPKGGTP